MMEENEASNKMSVYTYKCEKCLVSYGSFKDIDSLICPLCGSSSITKKEDYEKRKLYYIPFYKTEEDAYKTFQEKIKLNPLIPFPFKQKKTFENIKKIYLPAFLLDAEQKGVVSFLGGEKEVTKSGKEKNVETKKYDVVHSVHLHYNGVLLNVSNKINDNIFKEVCNYDSSLFRLLEKQGDLDDIYIIPDDDIQDIAKRGRERISNNTLNLVRNNVFHPLKKLLDDNTTISFENTKQVLLPVYYIIIPYRNKEYHFVMNGNNGKSYVEITMGLVNLIVFSILVFIIIFILGYCIAYFF